MDFAVLGAFSVVLRAFGGSLGPLLSLLGSLPGTLGGFQGALGALLGALLGLFGTILTSQPVTPSFVGACSRLQEAFPGQSVCSRFSLSGRPLGFNRGMDIAGRADFYGVKHEGFG